MCPTSVIHIVSLTEHRRNPSGGPLAPRPVPPLKTLLGSAAAALVVLTFAAAPASAFTITFSEFTSPVGPLVRCDVGRCGSRFAPDPIPADIPQMTPELV